MLIIWDLRLPDPGEMSSDGVHVGFSGLFVLDGGRPDDQCHCQSRGQPRTVDPEEEN